MTGDDGGRTLTAGEWLAVQDRRAGSDWAKGLAQAVLRAMATRAAEAPRRAAGLHPDARDGANANRLVARRCWWPPTSGTVLGWGALARAGDMGRNRRLPLRACMLSGMVREELSRVRKGAMRPALGGTAAALAGLDEDEVEAWAEDLRGKGQGAAGGKAAELAKRWRVERCAARWAARSRPLSGCLARC